MRRIAAVIRFNNHGKDNSTVMSGSRLNAYCARLTHAWLNHEGKKIKLAQSTRFVTTNFLAFQLLLDTSKF